MVALFSGPAPQKARAVLFVGESVTSVEKVVQPKKVEVALEAKPIATPVPEKPKTKVAPKKKTKRER